MNIDVRYYYTVFPDVENVRVRERLLSALQIRHPPRSVAIDLVHALRMQPGGWLKCGTHYSVKQISRPKAVCVAYYINDPH